VRFLSLELPSRIAALQVPGPEPPRVRWLFGSSDDATAFSEYSAAQMGIVPIAVAGVRV
jgi:hypothetical protein